MILDILFWGLQCVVALLAIDCFRQANKCRKLLKESKELDEATAKLNSAITKTFVMVPREPTQKMRKAAQRAEIDLNYKKEIGHVPDYECAWPAVWPAMIKAAEDEAQTSNQNLND